MGEITILLLTDIVEYDGHTIWPQPALRNALNLC